MLLDCGFVKDLCRIFHENPKDVTLCMFSSALSQCLSPLCCHRATVANVCLEMESTNINLGLASCTTPKFQRAPLHFRNNCIHLHDIVVLLYHDYIGLQVTVTFITDKSISSSICLVS